MKLGLAMVRLTLHMHRFSGSSSSLCSPSWLPSTSGAISMTLVCTASRNLTLAVTGSRSRGYEIFRPCQVLETLVSNNRLVGAESVPRPEKLEVFGARKANTGGAHVVLSKLPTACAWAHTRSGTLNA